MCSVTSAWLTKPWKNSCARSTSNSPIMRALERHVHVEARAAGEIDHHARQRLVERHVGVAVAAHALLVADRLGDRLAERDADVLDRVVAVDVQVALGLDLEVDQAVARDLVEHVVEERHAGGELRRAGAVEVDATRICVSLVLRVTSAVRMVSAALLSARFEQYAVFFRRADREAQAVGEQRMQFAGS